MPRPVRIGLLLDLYGGLLTDRQREFVRLHFNEDQSFGEISVSYNISRQAIHDAVKHAEQSLEYFESKLRLLERGIPALRKEVGSAVADAEGADDAGYDSDAGDGAAGGLTSQAMAAAALRGGAGSGAGTGQAGAVATSGAPAAPATPEEISRAVSEALKPVAEGLEAIKKRIQRSGGIIYDADGLLAEVNKLLNRSREQIARADASPSGAAGAAPAAGTGTH